MRSMVFRLNYKNMKNITCFVPFQSEQQVQPTVQNLSKQTLVAEVHYIKGDIRSTENMRSIAAQSHTPYTLIYTKYTTLSFVLFALERMEALMEDSGAAMVYALRRWWKLCSGWM